MSATARVASLSFVIASALLVSPSHAADSKLDPDPKILPKARTLVTVKVDQNFDLPSDKIPFQVRFGICVVQLTAIRDEGRALPADAGRARQGDRRLPCAGNRAEGLFGEDQRG
jgi:hypothetical protein